MKELVEQLRREKRQAEAKAKSLEEKSDPVPREMQYAYARGLFRAIELIESGSIKPEIKHFNLVMRDKSDEEVNWGQFMSLSLGQEFDFSWLNPQKIVDDFVFRIEGSD